MPGFDATGPRGMGSGAGWGRGPCGAGLRRGGGRILGRGSWDAGRGRIGSRRRYGPQELGPFGPADSAGPGSLPDEVAALRMALETIQQRLAALESSQP